jgi:hypothetical protein
LNDWIGSEAGRDGRYSAAGDGPPFQLDRAQLNWLLKLVFTTRPDELNCGECFEVIDSFAELKLTGRNAAEAMPLVQDHLDRCPPCKEEFEALLDALRAISTSD